SVLARRPERRAGADAARGRCRQHAGDRCGPRRRRARLVDAGLACGASRLRARGASACQGHVEREAFSRAMIAITRDISPAIDRCELTHLARVPIDVASARAQHAEYERCLADLGLRVERLPASDAMPDSVFIEDTALVFDELAVIARPGAASRRAETAVVEGALGRHRTLRSIEAPATLDGGDVVVAGRRVFAGASARTNAAGIEQLRAIVEPYGYAVSTAPVTG